MFDNLFVGYYISRQFWQQEVTPLRTADCYELELYMTDNGESIVDGRPLSARERKSFIHTSGANAAKRPRFRVLLRPLFL